MSHKTAVLALQCDSAPLSVLTIGDHISERAIPRAAEGVNSWHSEGALRTAMESSLAVKTNTQIKYDEGLRSWTQI